MARLAIGAGCSCGLAAGRPLPSTNAACPCCGQLTADTVGAALVVERAGRGHAHVARVVQELAGRVGEKQGEDDAEQQAPAAARGTRSVGSSGLLFVLVGCRPRRQ